MSVEILSVPGLEDQSARFIRALAHLALTKDLDPSALAAVMSFETASLFKPGRYSSGAVGLIQFTRIGAEAIGTTKEHLASLTQLEQLEWVGRYFDRVAQMVALPRAQWTASDHYLAVFAPAGIGKEDDFVLYAAPSDSYRANEKMDADTDGVIDVGDVRQKFERFVTDASRRDPITIDIIGPFGRLAPMLALGAMGALIVREARP